MASFTCPSCGFILLSDDDHEEDGGACPACGCERLEARLEAALQGTPSARGRLPTLSAEAAAAPRPPRPRGWLTGLVTGLLLAALLLAGGWQAGWRPRHLSESPSELERRSTAAADRLRAAEARATTVESDLLDARAQLGQVRAQHLEAERTLSQMQSRFAALEGVHVESLQILRATQSERDALLDELDDLRAEAALASSGERVAWLRRWMIVGPLPFDESRARFDAVERAPYRADLQLEGLNGSVGWRLHAGSEDRVHLERFLDCRERAMTYLIAWVHASPAPQRAQLSIGSDDGCVLWVNREQKFEFRGSRSSSPAQDRVAIDLAGGWNEILVLVDNSGGSDWGWYCEVRTADGSQPLPVVLGDTPPTPRPRRSRPAAPAP